MSLLILKLLFAIFTKCLEDKMAKIYASLIKKGEKTIDDVPVLLREQVQKLLAEGGEEK